MRAGPLTPGLLLSSRYGRGCCAALSGGRIGIGPADGKTNVERDELK